MTSPPGGSGRHIRQLLHQRLASVRVWVQVHGALLHHHAALLLLPGLLRGRPLLSGPHGDGGGQAAHPGGPGHLVVRGPHPAHHREPDAERLQQLVHLLLTRGGAGDPGQVLITPGKLGFRGQSDGRVGGVSASVSMEPFCLFRVT